MPNNKKHKVVFFSIYAVRKDPPKVKQLILSYANIEIIPLILTYSRSSKREKLLDELSEYGIIADLLIMGKKDYTFDDYVTNMLVKWRPIAFYVDLNYDKDYLAMQMAKKLGIKVYQI